VLCHVLSSLQLVVMYKVAMRTKPFAPVIHFVAPPGVERAKHQHPTLGGSTYVGSNIREDVSARRGSMSADYTVGVPNNERELVEFVHVRLTARLPAH